MNIDQKILERAKSGNIKAFEDILSVYEKPIFNYIRRWANRRQDAEDLTQDVFIRVYKSLKSIDLQKSFKAWLYKIATNVVYDWLRKKQGKIELFTIDDGIHDFETIESDSSYINIESAKDLEAALEKIKPVYKNVLLLFYHDDLSYQEIADALNLPINTVKVCLYRAKKSLKAKLNYE